ncbi:MAG: thiamine phosphate synthase [Polyangiaceae bacterium]|nr:thiamine phosphate synthase [Polyangiaceae bacterium]
MFDGRDAELDSPSSSSSSSFLGALGDPSPGSVPRLTQITDHVRVPFEVLRSRLERAPEPVLVQVRDKDLDEADRIALASRLRDLARALGHLVVFNGAWEVALALGLDGVHLSGDRAHLVRDARSALGESALITVACHDVDDVLRAAALGASSAILSPIFATPGKGTPLALESLERARAALDRQSASTRLVALGGIDETTASSCIDAGADGVAVIRADLVAWLQARKLDAPIGPC